MMLEEMRAFVALNIFLGIKCLPEQDDSLLGVSAVKKVMRRSRFEKIRKYLCMNDRERMPPQDDQAHDKFYKVRPLLHVISNKFCDEYMPSQFVSIDEAMVKYKGRLSFKQYLPKKPIKRVIKCGSVHMQRMGLFVHCKCTPGKMAIALFPTLLSRHF